MVRAIWKDYAGGDDNFGIAAHRFVNSKNLVGVAIPWHNRYSLSAAT
jgi:hypothetical protein